MTKALGVMCCGCNRMMGIDGKPIRFEPGVTIQSGVFAWFESKELADEFANKAGWRAENGDHRCQDCVEEEIDAARSPRRGGYVDLSAFHRGRI